MRASKKVKKFSYTSVSSLILCVYTAMSVDWGHPYNPGQEKQSKGSVEDYQMFLYMVLSGQADHMPYVSKQ